MSIRVLLADDHKVIVDGLRGLLELEDDIEVVGEASNGRDVIELVRRLRPDIVVMDITMPGLNGIAATEQILRQFDETEVIALSVHNRGKVASDMVRAGAAGYVVKNAAIKEVICAIRAVASGRRYYASSVALDAPDNSDGKPKPRAGRSSSALSNREREVLQLVTEGKSSKEIARILHVTTKTVSCHRQSIMDKLQIRSTAELTKYSVREGLTPQKAGPSAMRRVVDTFYGGSLRQAVAAHMAQQDTDISNDELKRLADLIRHRHAAGWIDRKNRKATAATHKRAADFHHSLGVNIT